MGGLPLAPSELRRVGRLADGWLASFTTPEQCKAARVTVEEAADAAGRAIDPEHFGVMALYTHDAIPDAFAQAIKTRNPDVALDTEQLSPEQAAGVVLAKLEELGLIGTEVTA